MTRPVPFKCRTLPDGKLCTACCTVVPFSDKDKAALSALKPYLNWRKADGRWIIVQAELTGRCPFLGANGCTVHGTPAYPLICGFFGGVRAPYMTCPYGCGPKENRKLSAEECDRALLAELKGGPDA